MKLDALLCVLDRIMVGAAIVFVGALVGIVCRSVWGTGDVEVRLPPAFPIVSSGEHARRVDVANTASPTLQQLVIAESCMLEGGRELNHGSVAQARQWFRRAVATAPGVPRYHQALKAADDQAADNEVWLAIRDLLRTDDLGQAWTAFVAAAGRDPVFFARFGPEFARELQGRRELASATSVMLTYCQMRPADEKEQVFLRELTAGWRQQMRQTGGCL